MEEKEAEKALFVCATNEDCRVAQFYKTERQYEGSYEEAYDTIIQALEEKDKRIDKLEKALIQERMDNNKIVEEKDKIIKKLSDDLNNVPTKPSDFGLED